MSNNEDNGTNGDEASKNADSVVITKPLASTRSRRTNAGNRMGQMILDEEDDLYANLYGGFYEEEDDADFHYEGADRASNSNSDSGSQSESDSTSSDSDEQEQSEDEVEYIETKEATRKQCPPGSPSNKAYKSCRRICCVCLGDNSDEDDEIIECDGCGVSVHETCYGETSDGDHQNETVSIHSNISSESTEPWFCEPCTRSVTNPMCELCPNTGGIFKQTDTGRWVHMVCALYTRGVTFENVQNLKDVSLFELNYGLYGSKTCTICEDTRLSRSGICIGCDAGLCKTFFHPTCAQREGLLFESHADDIDPYFAQCKQHADKDTIKRKKRTCTALFARLKKIQRLENPPDRINSKTTDLAKCLNKNLTRWTPENHPPIPQRVSRMLMTSPSLIQRLTKKSQLMGLDINSNFMSVQDEAESARQKWHITPAFTLEFVAYCRDRGPRMEIMKKRNRELMEQNSKLKEQETTMRDSYNSIQDTIRQAKKDLKATIGEIVTIQQAIASKSGKPYPLPLHVQHALMSCVLLTGSSFKKTNNNDKTSSTYQCHKCGSVKDQHLLSLCDTCNSHFHIYCLDPPLARVPKKTKFGGWQCSDCSEKGDEEEEQAIEEQNSIAAKEAEEPRKLRERIKYPEKYSYESMMMADFWSTNNKRKSRKTKGGKKVKVST